MEILNAELAQDIVDRTMRIIPYNVNVMDARGCILASGNPARIGELHAGALLALDKQLVIEVDAEAALKMPGAQPGINLPLCLNGQVCGAVGLSGAPAQVRQFGELVRLTAEMILEQAHLTGELQRDFRYREAFVLDLIRLERGGHAALEAWAQRLGVHVQRRQVVFLLLLDGQEGGNVQALAEIQRLQMRLLVRQPAALTAAVGAAELVILESCETRGAGPEPQAQPQRLFDALAALLRDECRQPHTLTMGIALPGIDGAAISYQSAQSTARIGQARDAGRRTFSYYDQALPVLLSGLGAGWQAEQLRLPLAKLQAQDKNKGVLQRTLEAWFTHGSQLAATAAALHIHRNTLDYRLRRIGEITGLDLARTEGRFLLYVSLQLQDGKR